MPPMVKRRGSAGSPTVVSDSAMGPLLVKGARSGSEGTKRPKLGSPKGARGDGVAAAAAAVSTVGVDVTSDASSVDVGVGRSRKRAPKVRVARVQVPAVVGGALGAMQEITAEFSELVLGATLTLEQRMEFLRMSQRYERLLIELMGENERLKGRLDGAQSRPAEQAVVGGARPIAAAAVAASPAQAVAVPKPVDTWAVVVRGKGATTSKQVVEKVVKEVGPSLGVRVHEVRAMKDGGAVIRAPSVAEREKIAANSKFGECGLEVSVVDKLGPKIVVQNVHKLVSPDEFMGELYSMNLGDLLSEKQFPKSVRMVSAPWKEEDGVTNVTLECTQRVADHLRATGVYIKWFRFLVRMVDVVAACHRCYGFDHRVKECRMKEDVCRLCGQCGHMASRCSNPVHCRNCALRRRDAAHPMMSMQCPVYAEMVARANARH